MCTVSVISIEEGRGLRLVTNRDESPARLGALPPRRMPRVRGGADAYWPIDGLAGGTWVAAGEQGLVLAILNGNFRKSPPSPTDDRRLSRGGIIPRLIGTGSATEAAHALQGLEVGRFEPFRLIAADAIEGVRIVESVWDGRSLSTIALGAGPACFASSGLGDWLVEPRLELFERMVVAAGALPGAQDSFHGHQWPERPEISVMMERGAARTISVTRVELRPVEVGRFRVAMDYRPVEAPAGSASRV